VVVLLQICKAVSFVVYVCRPDIKDLLRQTGSRNGVSLQYYLVVGIPEQKKYLALCKEKITRRSQYTFKYRNELYIITGIACLPLSKEYQSPDAEIVTGGVNHCYVVIRLTPEKEYEYACEIIITGKKRQPHRRQR